MKISIRISPLQYTIIQINVIHPLYQRLFINVTKHQLIHAQNQIFNPYTYTLFNLINVNVHANCLFHVTLLIKILIITKSRRNFFLTSQVLVINTLFVLVTPLQSQPTKKEAHRSPQMSTLRHTTLLCWRLMTSCHHPSLRWYWHPQYPSQFAKCKHPPSSRWRKLHHSHSLWTQRIMRG